MNFFVEEVRGVKTSWNKVWFCFQNGQGVQILSATKKRCFGVVFAPNNPPPPQKKKKKNLSSLLMVRFVMVTNIDRMIILKKESNSGNQNENSHHLRDQIKNNSKI